MLWLWPSSLHLPESQTLKNFDQNYAARETRCSPSVLAAMRSDNARAARAEDCASESERRRREQWDIAQSIRTTNASEQAVRLAYDQTRASVAGGALLVLTLMATAWAAYAASEATRLAKASQSDTKESLRIASEAASSSARAARHTASVAHATERTNTTMREAAVTQLRPYVYLKDELLKVNFMMGEVSGNPEVTLTFHNYGATPARNTKVRATVIVGGNWRDDPGTDWEALTDIYFGDMPPKSDRVQDGFFVAGMNKEASVGLLEGTRSVIIDGVINYEDGNGTVYATQFRRAATSTDWSKRKFATTPGGNTST
jgi:hypothetical protein